MKWGLRRSLVAALVSLSCLFGFITISAAATDSKPLSLTKYTKHHGHKKVARRHIHRPKVAKTSSQQQVANDDGNDDAATKTGLSPRVADAHAELSAGDVAPRADVSTLTETDKIASPATQNGVEIAAADQLNDIDRDAAAEPVTTNSALDANAMQPAPHPIQATPAINSTPVEQLSVPAPVQRASLPHSDWDGASLVAKVFVGFGLTLTLVSAARLMIA